MMLVAILLTPLCIAVLFIVMSWSERALDHQTGGPQRAAAPDVLAPATIAGMQHTVASRFADCTDPTPTTTTKIMGTRWARKVQQTSTASSSVRHST